MRAFLQPISARIYFGKTASHRKRARFVQSRGASPQAYWMSVKAAQRWGRAKRAFCGVCFLMPGGLTGVLFLCTGRRGDVGISPPTGDLPHPSVGRGPRAPPRASCIARRDTWVPPYESYCAPFGAEHHRQADVGADDSVRPNSAKRCHSEPVIVSLAWESGSFALLRGLCRDDLRQTLAEQLRGL